MPELTMTAMGEKDLADLSAHLHEVAKGLVSGCVVLTAGDVAAGEARAAEMVAHGVRSFRQDLETQASAPVDPEPDPEPDVEDEGTVDDDDA